jgi:hypothetical protein
LQGSAKVTATCGSGSCQQWVSSTYAYCRDIWAHGYVGTQDTTTPGGGWGSLTTSYTTTVPAQSVVMLWISNKKPAAPASALY